MARRGFDVLIVTSVYWTKHFESCVNPFSHSPRFFQNKSCLERKLTGHPQSIRNPRANPCGTPPGLYGERYRRRSVRQLCIAISFVWVPCFWLALGPGGLPWRRCLRGIRRTTLIIRFPAHALR